MSKRRQVYAVVADPIQPPSEPGPPAVPPVTPRGRRYGIHQTQGSRLKGRFKRWRRLQRSTGARRPWAPSQPERG